MNEDTVYRRLSFRERGHFSNHFTFRPVSALQFLHTGLHITRGNSIVAAPYKNSRVVIKIGYIAKGYGRAHAWLKQTLVSVLPPDGQRYTFDLSGQFPDFKERKAILALIQERFVVEKQTENLAQVKRRMLVAPLVLYTLMGIGAVVFYLATHPHGG